MNVKMNVCYTCPYYKMKDCYCEKYLRGKEIAVFLCPECNSRDDLNSRQALEKAQEQRWISVSERLPQTTGTYLVTKIDSDTLKPSVDFAHWIDGMDFNNGFVTYDNVTAWQPLPDPYKEEQE